MASAVTLLPMSTHYYKSPGDKWIVTVHGGNFRAYAPPSCEVFDDFLASDLPVSLVVSGARAACALRSVECVAKAASRRVTQIHFHAADDLDGNAVCRVLRLAVCETSTSPVAVSMFADEGLRLDFSQIPSNADLLFLDPTNLYHLMYSLGHRTHTKENDKESLAMDMQRKWGKFLDDRKNLAALVTAGATDASQETPIGRFLNHATLFDPRILDLVSKFALSS